MRQRLAISFVATACLYAVGLSPAPAARARSLDVPAGDASAPDRLRPEDGAVVTRTLRFAGDGERTLDVRLIHGSIRVAGSSGDEVRVEVRQRIRADSDADRDAAARDVSLDLVENGTTVEAVAREPWSDVCGAPSSARRWQKRGQSQQPGYQVTFDLDIHVPRRTRLRLCTINSGDVLVEGTAGAFDITHVNGRIVMQNVRGAGRVQTVNGPIVASFAAAPDAPTLFKTINGNIDVTFPRAMAADLTMKTFNGGLFTDFDIQPLPQSAAARVDKRGGLSVYRSNEFTRVRTGRGGPEVTFDTLNGDVRVVRGAS